VGLGPDLGFGILGLPGQQGFFSNFRVTFDQPHGFFKLEPL
jgi:hypothetical protein